MKRIGLPGKDFGRQILREGKKFCAVMLALLLLLPLYAGAEEIDYWICPDCGKGANTGNFCTNCGQPKPVSDVNEALTQIPGETDKVMVDILRIDASAYVSGKKDKYQYASWNIADEDRSTCWQFNAKNVKKKNAWLSMIIEGQTVDEIWIRNGNQGFNNKGKYLYPEYARAKEIRVVFDFTDSPDTEEMDFTLSDENAGDWEKVDTGRHENVYSVWIYVRSVYKGKSKATNACISEVMLVQNAPAEKAKPADE